MSAPRNAADDISVTKIARPLVIGLTGPIASGKSTVAEFLRERGAEVIDADRVYRSLLTPGSDLWQRIVARFGRSIVDADEEIDRAALAKIVFADADALADLDRISHPAVVAEIRRRISRSAARVVVIEAIKLAQAGLVADVDSLWLVTADEKTRLERLLARPGIDADEARRRIATAPDPLLSTIHFDMTIDTSGGLSATARQVDDAWRLLVLRTPRLDGVAEIS
jgi:dephospho-CoA kinase